MRSFRTTVLVGVVAMFVVACSSATNQATPVPTTAATPTVQASAAASSALPSFNLPHNAQELEALLPDKVGTTTLTKTSWSGQDFATQQAQQNAEFVAWLQGLGKSLNDVSVAAAFDLTGGGSILAFRIAGVDHNTLLSTLQTTLASDMGSPPTWTSATVGGKSVQQAPSSSGDLTQYLYGTADIVFDVDSKDATWAAEALSKLP